MLAPQKTQSAGQILNAAQLSPQVNSYTINPGPPKTITVTSASRLAQLQKVSVSGTLLPKQLIAIDPKTNRRTVSHDPNGYAINPSDGDLHLNLGPTALHPHITCELQSATSFLPTFKAAIGKQIIVEGLFRCLFEHPGFRGGDDAHIFEIHPVRTVNISGKIHNFDVGIPENPSIHTWSSPHKLNDQDKKIRVRFVPASDTLTFSGMDGSDENYVRVTGTASQVKLNLTGGLAAFVLTSPEIGHSIRVLCLRDSTAAKQLSQMKGSRITMVALRNIDLADALRSRYTINLLGVDIQPA